jgi:hypothetical protein
MWTCKRKVDTFIPRESKKTNHFLCPLGADRDGRDIDRFIQKGSNFCNDLRLDLWGIVAIQGPEGLENERSKRPGRHHTTSGLLGAESAQIIEQWSELGWFLLPPGTLR